MCGILRRRRGAQLSKRRLALKKHGIFAFENKRHPVASSAQFAKRMLRSFGIASALVVSSLLVGMAGYHFTEDLPWLDSFVNAAMILSGIDMRTARQRKRFQHAG